MKVGWDKRRASHQLHHLRYPWWVSLRSTHPTSLPLLTEMIWEMSEETEFPACKSSLLTFGIGAVVMFMLSGLTGYFGREDLGGLGAFITAVWFFAGGLFFGFLGPYSTLRLRVTDTEIDVRYMLSWDRNKFLPWQHITRIEIKTLHFIRRGPVRSGSIYRVPSLYTSRG